MVTRLVEEMRRRTRVKTRRTEERGLKKSSHSCLKEPSGKTDAKKNDKKVALLQRLGSFLVQKT